CGAGWLCPWLKPFGRVTATDLSDEVLARARARIPDVKFIAGDFMTMQFADANYDVVIALELLSHIADQPALIARLPRMLLPGGLLMLATQNRPVLERYNTVEAPKPGQVRHWVDRHELKNLLSPHFAVDELLTITPRSNRGLFRLIAGRKTLALMRLFT